MYAFIGHESALEALRFLSVNALLPDSRWPSDPRRLPLSDCVTSQSKFKQFREEIDLAPVGVRSSPVHLMVPSQSMRSSGKAARLHVWSPDLPARSCLRVDDKVLLSGPEFTIIQLCGITTKLEGLLDAHVDAVQAERSVLAELGLNERPTVDHPLRWEHERRIVAAAVVACEFAGTYRLGVSGKGPSYRIAPIMSMEGFARMAQQVGGSTASARAYTVACLAFDGSASPMETALALMLSLPLDYGGFELQKPWLNASIDVSAHRGAVADCDQVTPDFLWPEERVALEYDSEEFHADDDKGTGRDAVRSNILTSLGYRVFRATPKTVRSLAGVELLARQLASAIGTELKAPSDIQALRRQRLFALLMPRRSDA